MFHPIHAIPGMSAKGLDAPGSDEPALRLLRRFVKAGDHAVVVGTHIEESTRELSRLVGSAGMIWAFEPVPEKFVALNALANQLGNVYPYQCALGKQPGLAYFSVSDSPGPDGPYRAGFSDGQGRNDFPVKVEPLDTCIRERVHLIRIDVAGAEVEILAGAQRIIGEYHPAFRIGLRRKTGREVFRMLHAAAYQGFALHSPPRSVPDYRDGEDSDLFFFPSSWVAELGRGRAACA